MSDDLRAVVRRQREQLGKLNMEQAEIKTRIANDSNRAVQIRREQEKKHSEIIASFDDFQRLRFEIDSPSPSANDARKTGEPNEPEPGRVQYEQDVDSTTHPRGSSVSHETPTEKPMPPPSAARGSRGKERPTIDKESQGNGHHHNGQQGQPTNIATERSTPQYLNCASPASASTPVVHETASLLNSNGKRHGALRDDPPRSRKFIASNSASRSSATSDRPYSPGAATSDGADEVPAYSQGKSGTRSDDRSNNALRRPQGTHQGWSVTPEKFSSYKRGYKICLSHVGRLLEQTEEFGFEPSGRCLQCEARERRCVVFNEKHKKHGRKCAHCVRLMSPCSFVTDKRRRRNSIDLTPSLIVKLPYVGKFESK